MLFIAFAAAVLLLVILGKWLFSLLFRQNIPSMVRKFNADGADFYSERFSGVLHAFLSGHNRMLKPFLNISNERAGLDADFPPFYRGFAYEGAGMGLGARSSLWGGGRSFEKSVHELSPASIYQYYVGLGWWLHIRFGYRLKGYRKWLKRLDKRYGPILFDGVGFKTGLFSYAQDPGVVNSFTSFPSDYQRVCYQGFGRSLWFQNKFRIEPVLEEIVHLSVSYRNDIYSGVGLAVAYSMFDKIELAFKIYRQIPQQYRSPFAQGMAFGWEARRMQDEAYWNNMLETCSIASEKTIKMWVDMVHKAGSAARHGNAETHYVRWMDLTRHYIDNNGKKGVNECEEC